MSVDRRSRLRNDVSRDHNKSVSLLQPVYDWEAVAKRDGASRSRRGLARSRGVRGAAPGSAPAGRGAAGHAAGYYAPRLAHALGIGGALFQPTQTRQAGFRGRGPSPSLAKAAANRPASLGNTVAAAHSKCASSCSTPRPWSEKLLRNGGLRRRGVATPSAGQSRRLLALDQNGTVSMRERANLRTVSCIIAPSGSLFSEPVARVRAVRHLGLVRGRHCHHLRRAGRRVWCPGGACIRGRAPVSPVRPATIAPSLSNRSAADGDFSQRDRDGAGGSRTAPSTRSEEDVGPDLSVLAGTTRVFGKPAVSRISRPLRPAALRWEDDGRPASSR